MAEIISGKLKPGDQVPTEQSLCQTYGVSRTTVVKAILELEQAGHVVRQQGKGTFVADHKIEQPLFQLTSFSDEMQRRHLETSSRVLVQRLDRADARLADRLRIALDSEVVHIQRIRYANDEPLLLETVYLPHSVCPDLLKFDLARDSLYQILVSHYGLVLASARLELEPIILDAMQAGHLGVAGGSPAFLVSGLSHSNTGQPVEYVQSIYRGDRFRFLANTGPYEPRLELTHPAP